MERLTRYFYENCAGVDCEKCGRRKTGKCNTSADCVQTIADRLATIEDILGDDYDLDRLRVIVNQFMTVREEVAERFSITKYIPIDRLRELVEVDRDGRCVVLPCKIGSPVWRVYDDCEFPGDCGTKQKCKGCEYRNIFAEEQSFCLSMLSQNGKLGHPYYTSLEAAEAAMKGEQDG